MSPSWKEESSEGLQVQGQNWSVFCTKNYSELLELVNLVETPELRSQNQRCLFWPQGFSSTELVTVLNLHNHMPWVFASSPEDFFNELEDIEESLREKDKSLLQKAEYLHLYRELSSKRSELEAWIEESTRTLNESLSSEKERLAAEKSLIQFALILQNSSDLETFLGNLKRFFQSQTRTGNTSIQDVFLVQRNSQGHSIHFLEGKSLKVSFLSEVSKSELNQDSQVLPALARKKIADLVNRPVGKVIRLSQYAASTGQEIWLETNSSEPHSLQGRFEPLAQMAHIFFSRILRVEQIFSETHLWQRIFDGLAEPIAVIDESYRVKRANKAFAKHQGHFCYEIFLGRNKKCENCPGPITSMRSNNGGFDRKFEISEKNVMYRVFSQSLEDKFAVHLYEDVSKQRADLAELIQSEKLRTLGQIAGRFSHELTNPLSGIHGLTQTIIPDSKGQLREDLLQVEAATRRCLDIIRNLNALHFRSNNVNPSFSAHSTIKSVLPLVKTTIKTIALELNLEAKKELIVGPQVLFQQILVNLIQNASQALSEKNSTSGKIVLRTSNSSDSEVCIEVADNGPGVPPWVLEKAFQPFVTTKKATEGTGLGLFLTKRLTENLGGRVTLESSSAGTLFRLFFPTSTETANEG